MFYCLGIGFLVPLLLMQKLNNNNLIYMVQLHLYETDIVL